MGVDVKTRNVCFGQSFYRCFLKMMGMFAWLGLFGGSTAWALPEQPHVGMLYQRMKQWMGTGRVLYVAAHPDDENTRLLAYLVGERNIDAAYLSLTRGGGGQNLIGRELANVLGLIRTHELLQARRIDGAKQFFTRAKDFGFSKTSEETLRIWGHQAILSDMVWLLRNFRPHVVITRFPETGNTHGHHLASAQLARWAVEAASDPKQFPEQLTKVQPWRVLRLVHNGSTWWLRGKKSEEIKKYLSQFMRLDIGAYNALLGQSYGEIAARSRSMHKSQGFGAPLQRGPAEEYFKHVSGIPALRDILEGIPTSWHDIPETKQVAAKLQQAMEQAMQSFRPTQPELSLPGLIQTWQVLSRLPSTPWLNEKRHDLQELMLACAGLYLDAQTSRAAVVPGQSLSIVLHALNRSPAKVFLSSIQGSGFPKQTVQHALLFHQPWTKKVTLTLAGDVPLSVPSWLSRGGTLGAYAVPDITVVQRAVDPPPLQVQWEIRMESIAFRVTRPVRYVWTDRVQGEVARHVQIMPPITVTPQSPMLMFPNGRTQRLHLHVKSIHPKTTGILRVTVAPGWQVQPTFISLSFRKEGELQRHTFVLTPPVQQAQATVATPVVLVGNRSYAWKEHVLRYNHIPEQSVLEPSEVRLVPVKLHPWYGKVGYIPGAGDYVVDALRQVGVDVEILEPETVMTGQFQRYRTIVTGIRAYNQNRALRQMQTRLLEWVKQGGTLVVQYNTSMWWRPFRFPIGPYPLFLGRDRVTDETAPVFPIQSNHPLLRIPHRIAPADFSGWVQERGLYFASRWDSRYQPILNMSDPGQKSSVGSVLATTYGKGAYIYTGLSFFRQLPAGVPGAYRLFLNLLAYTPSRQHPAPSTQKSLPTKNTSSR